MHAWFLSAIVLYMFFLTMHWSLLLITWPFGSRSINWRLLSNLYHRLEKKKREKKSVILEYQTSNLEYKKIQRDNLLRMRIMICIICSWVNEKYWYKYENKLKQIVENNRKLYVFFFTSEEKNDQPCMQKIDLRHNLINIIYETH